jgi:hypothetical protein
MPELNEPVAIELTEDQVRFLINIGLEQIIREEIERRRVPALFQPRKEEAYERS